MFIIVRIHFLFTSLMESNFAKRVKEFRQYKKMSQTAFAEQCGLTQGNITHIEGGKEPLQSNVAKLIAGFPDLNAYWLLNGEGDMLRDGTTYTRINSTDSKDTGEQEAAESIETEEVEDDLPALTVSYSVARMTPEQRALHYQVLYENERQERTSERRHANRREIDLLDRLTRKPNASPVAAGLLETVDGLAKEFPIGYFYTEPGFKQAGRQLKLAQQGR
jgi:transcriptional regulator with XRE-family HTH domain